MNKSELKASLESFAAANNLRLNSNSKLVDALLDSLIKNKELRGNLYCPCRFTFKPDTVCPCVDCLSDIASLGHCHCSLFVK